MQTTVHFTDKTYDLDRLRAELAIVEGDLWHGIGYQEHYEGSWDSVAFIASGGDTSSDGVKQGLAPYVKTPLLEKCPYIEQIIDDFECEKQRVRLMRLAPGSVIKEHQDAGGGWTSGMVRLHLPIVTSDDVHFIVDGKRVPMHEGELWYADIMRPHSVRNEGDAERVHLVLDLLVNDYVRDMFPAESLRDRWDRFVFRTRPRDRFDRVWRSVWRYSGGSAIYRATGLKALKQRVMGS